MKKIEVAYFAKDGTELKRYIFDYHNVSHTNTYIGDVISCLRAGGKVQTKAVFKDSECNIVVNDEHAYITDLVV